MTATEGDKILALLKDKPQTTDEIVNALGVKPFTVLERIRKLVWADEIKSNAEHRWLITEKGIERLKLVEM